jgi:hypothetical protein
MKRVESNPSAAPPAKKIKCSFCVDMFSKLYNKKRHEIVCPSNPNPGESSNEKSCYVCDKKFQRNDYLKKHIKWHETSAAAAMSSSSILSKINKSVG